MISLIYGVTFVSFFRAVFNFSAVKKQDEIGQEGYNRLLTLFSKNKFGYNTRFMSDFDTFLESALNEKFVDESTKYYDDVFVAKEVEDVEAGLNGDFNTADVRHLLKDKAATKSYPRERCPASDVHFHVRILFKLLKLSLILHKVS